ncbi:DNA-3-methyladenine glycosylase I [Mycetocola zhujimingii]|uniref:DNA-3-methyladenine glycosylase I n=1 Tax=Mycetocola zhujimingii TaxID=2079792 RepID=A0A2U1TEJ7_9MICO|nr:DNA-3-methyladenine glycosylase I [Mycetocola zhujimingii]PWC07312.1 DNA-3-methyladenine glycosylase I [Mycetocola zhujimingii]
MPPSESIVPGTDGKSRCAWAVNDPEYQRYHDEEWGTPLIGDRAVFEKISLEGFQAGLSWITILKRRPAFREAFANFDIETVASFSDATVEELVQNPAIIRHRGKITAVIGNARATLQLGESLSDLVWSFRPDPLPPRPASFSDIPAITAESTALSNELRRRGFRFVGPTTMYALMQSAGIVDDHVEGCWRAV